jgi:hypothetical protein
MTGKVKEMKRLHTGNLWGWITPDSGGFEYAFKVKESKTVVNVGDHVSYDIKDSFVVNVTKL